MIYQQACKFFGWPQTQVDQQAFRVPLPALSLGKGAELYEAVSACYDIAHESRQLRNTMLNMPTQDAAVEFDRTRKEYHRRAEFSDLSCRTDDHETRELLSRLGFNVNEVSL